VLCMLSCFDIYFDGFLYFMCGVSDLVGRRIATSAIERLFSMRRPPRPLLRNGSVNTFQQQRLCFP
jgi:hypothetical protein